MPDAELVNDGRAWPVGWDNNFYLAWGRSLAVDGERDFENDIAYAGSLPSEGAPAFRDYVTRGERTATGRVANKYAVGTGLLALILPSASTRPRRRGDAGRFSWDWRSAPSPSCGRRT